MPDETPPPPADDLLQQLRAGNALAAEAANAVDQAAQAAQEIAGSIAEHPPTSPSSTPPAAAHPKPSASASTETAAPLSEPEAPFIEPLKQEVRRLLAIEVPVIVQLGARRLTVGEVMRFSVGAIIEFNKSAEEELELLANNKAIGKGQAVKVGENFGIKITTISPVKETIRKLGGL